MHPFEEWLLDVTLHDDTIKTLPAIRAIKDNIQLGLSFNVVDQAGNTSLHHAVQTRSLTVADLLMKEGINLEIRNNQGQTALDMAIEQENLDMVKLLLTYDARITDLDRLNLFLQSKDPEKTEVQYCKNKMYITISTIWIGDSPSRKITSSAQAGERTAGVTGQDITAVISMAACINTKYHTLLFWCLDKYTAYYDSILRQFGIQVCSIEEYLEKCNQRESLRRSVAIVRVVMNTLLSSDRNTLRDRVTVKNIVSLFLLKVGATHFYKDSNAGPSKHLPLKLHKYNSFYAPYFSEPKYEGIDVWLLYAPPNSQHARIAFNYFYTHWKDAERIYFYEGYSDRYRAEMGALIVASVNAGTEKGQEMKVWFVDNVCDDKVEIKELGIQKYYDNTHKRDRHVEYEEEQALVRNHFNQTIRAVEISISKTTYGFFCTPLRNTIYDYLSDEEGKDAIKQFPNFPQRGRAYTAIFIAASNGNLDRLKELIELGTDVNQTVTKPKCEGLTPLHMAIEAKQFEAFRMLLAHGARVDIVFKDTTGEWNAYDYIHYMIPPNEAHPFLALYEQYHPPFGRVNVI